MTALTQQWPEVLATVTACEYDFGAGQALAFGVPTGKHFRISFNYWVDGELHTGEFYSDTALPQGHLFPVNYNPSAPHEHSKSGSTPSTKGPLIAFGIAGSIVLSLLWFAMLRGCNPHR